MEVQGVATVLVHTQDGDTKQLRDVEFVPGLALDLLSVGQLLTKGYSVVFKGDNCIIIDD